MKTFSRALLLAGLSLVLMGAASGRITKTITNADQRTRSPASARLWSMSFSAVGKFKILKASNATAEAEEQLFLNDAQVAVTCSERSAHRAHRSSVLGCWLQAQSATVSIGLESYCTPSGTSCIPPVYNLGVGAGVITYVDKDGNTAAGYGACFVVPAGVGPIYNLVPSEAFRDATAATHRTKKCTNGHPCRIDADCSDSTTCATGTPTGVFIGLVSTSTSVDCQIQEAM